MESVANMLAAHHTLLSLDDAQQFAAELGTYCLELPPSDPIFEKVRFVSDNGVVLIGVFLVPCDL